MKTLSLDKKTLIICAALLCSATAFAVQKPRSLSTDKRIKVVTYQKNNVVNIYGTTFVTTQVVFGKGERVADIECGDLPAWTATVPKFAQNTVFFKPTITNSNTNVTVLTNKHTYYFHLTSNKNPTQKSYHQTYLVKFIYPTEERAKLLARLNYRRQQKRALLNHSKNPSDYNWHYSFSGSHSIVPIHVFDDGRFTYMELRRYQRIPAIFAVDNRVGKESVVNFRRKGRYIIIQRVAPQFTLREGKHIVASIFNNRMIARRG